MQQSPGDCQDVDAGGPGLKEHARAGIGGCGSRTDVVDEEHPRAGYGVAGPHRYRAAEVPAPLDLAQAHLRIGRSQPDQRLGVEWQVEAAGGAAGEEQSLVEAPLAQARQMQGYGNDDIDLAPLVGESLGEKLGQRSGQRAAPGVFEGTESGAERVAPFIARAIAGDRASACESGRVCEATAAEMRGRARERQTASRAVGLRRPAHAWQASGAEEGDAFLAAADARPGEDDVQEPLTDRPEAETCGILRVVKAQNGRAHVGRAYAALASGATSFRLV